MFCLIQHLDALMQRFRPAFSRQATFHWFVLLLWGTLLCERSAAITSYLNAIGLSPKHYTAALHWFYSSAYTLQRWWTIWSQVLGEHPAALRLKTRLVYVADSLKVSKEGRKMPGAKKLYQASQNINKPTWICGHYYGLVGALMGRNHPLWATLICAQIQDGYVPATDITTTTVDKMIDLCIQVMQPHSYVLLDAYYSAKKRWSASVLSLST